MRVLVAVFIGSLAGTTAAHAQYTDIIWPPQYDTAYGLLVMQHDPWTYSAGSGPAGGWGIGGAATNPASLAMSTDASVDLSRPGAWTVFGAGIRLSPEWYGGVHVTAIGQEGAGTYALSPHGDYSSVLEAGDFLARASLAYRHDENHSFGVSVKYLEIHRARGVEVNNSWYVQSPADLYQPAVDIGYRLEGVLPGLTFLSWEERTLKITRGRWRPGAKFGISLNNAGVSMNQPRFGDLPIFLNTGVSYSPILTTVCCVTVGASHQYRLAGPAVLTAHRHLLTVGAGIEVNEAAEAGFAITGLNSGIGTGVEMFAAMGPPHWRLVVSRVVERSYWGTRYASRAMLRFQFDFDKSDKSDKRKLPDPYEHL